MGEHDRPWIGLAQLADIGGGELLVNLAAPAPGDDLDPGLRRDVPGEVFIRRHDHARRAERFDDLHRIGRGAADIRRGLHRGRSVDVGDDRRVGIKPAQETDVVGVDRLGERAAGPGVGDQHRLRRIEQLGGLGHEMHARHHDHPRVPLGCLARQHQAVAHDIGDAMEDFRRLVVVGQDDRVALALEAQDRLNVVLEGGPLDRRDDAAHALIEAARGALGVQDGHGLYSH